jgi:hypothetical protein
MLVAFFIVSPVGIVASFAFAKYADTRFRDSKRQQDDS